MITKQDLKEVLQKYRFSEEQIERILNKRIKYLLKVGNKENIDAILKILVDERKVPQEKVEECLTVLALGKAKEIKKIFEVLDSNQIGKAQIENNLGYLLLNNANEIDKIFTEGSIFLKRYMQLKGIYDKVVTEEEIQNICEEKKISQSEFMRHIRGENYQELYQETLKRKRGIYIGKSIPVQEDFINKNGTILIELSRNVSKNFGYRYKMNDLPELESQALEIMITKCGDITYNFEWNLEVLKRALYKKTFNYLKRNLRAKEILQDFSTSEIERNARFSNMIEEEKDNELDLSTWNINEEQEDILRYISTYLEEGYNLSEAIGSVANMLSIDEEEILEEIEKIKEQNDKNKIKMGEENELS